MNRVNLTLLTFSILLILAYNYFSRMKRVDTMNKTRDKHIWIEAEEWADGEWDIEDTNLDVIVTFSDRSKYIASFFTYKNIESLREKNEQTGAWMSGTYFWASDMVLIETASRERIYELIEYLIDHNEFASVFTQSSDVDSEDDHLYPKGFFKDCR